MSMLISGGAMASMSRAQHLETGNDGLHTEGEQTDDQEGLKYSPFIPHEGLAYDRLVPPHILPGGRMFHTTIYALCDTSDVLQRGFVESCGNRLALGFDIPEELVRRIVAWDAALF
jgi:hypothetical protein